jgi:hypothetical protein
MKESNFYSDDFEQLIRDKTEQYKMYPSERVWKGVHNSLHTKRRWFIGSMSLLVTGILFWAGRELITPSNRSAALHKPAVAAAAVTEAPKPYLAAHIPHTHTSPHSDNTSTLTAHRNNTADANPTGELQPEYSDISITISHLVIDPSNLSDWLGHIQLPDHAPEIAVIAPHSTGTDGGKTAEDGSRANRPGADIASNREPIDGSRGTIDDSRGLADGARDAEESNTDLLSARGVLESLGARGVDARNTRMNGRLVKNRSNSNIVGDALRPDSAAGSAQASATTIAESRDRQRINWLHDYALNTLPEPNKHGRTFFQLTLSPTVNYRSISGIDGSYEKWGNISGFGMSPSKLTNTSPAFGFEFGGSILYRLTRNLSVKGGLRFNFARYKITAFATGDPNTQQGVTLNSYLGYVVDTLQRGTGPAAAAQRASLASNPVSVQTINNDYYQLSAPIGFELRVLGNERLQFNLGATVQPSYLLGTTSYTLTQDMMQYSKQPNEYRKWNVSGGIEAFLSYRMGNIRWQIGPEFRYQFLSTYGPNYPCTENLKTYGIKIGITKMLP